MAHFQTSLAEIGLLPGKATRRAEFFQRLEALVPWDRWVAIVDSRRDDRVGPGRKATKTETMLRMLVVQRCLNLSDEECEDQCVDSRALSAFLGAPKVPDKTTLCKFRNWLAAEGAEREIFDDLAARLQAEGLMMREGSVVDATFVESPSSTKNRDHARDPEAHQAKMPTRAFCGRLVRRSPARLAERRWRALVSNETACSPQHMLYGARGLPATIKDCKVGVEL